MKQVIAFPPNIKLIREHFFLDETKNILYTYGDIIYNPSGTHIPDHLIVHEHTHTIQQGDDPEAWWDRYIKDEKFRLDQEKEAYHNQYQKFCTTEKDRNRRAQFLNHLAHDLSSPMYGNCTSFLDARKHIQNAT